MIGSNTRILLVEDNPGDARLIQEMLVGLKGENLDLQHADRCSNATEKLNEQDFDLVLLDLNLTDSDGLDTFEKVKNAAPEVPVVVMTGFDDQTLAVEAVRRGAQDYLVKGQVDGGWLAKSIRYAIERRRSELALREGEKKYRTLFEDSMDAICMIEEDGTITEANMAWMNLFGYRQQDLKRGLNAAALYCDSADRGRFRAELEPEGSVRDWEVRLKSKDGTELTCLLTASMRRGRDGRPSAVQAIVRDITEQKKLERQLQLSQRLEAIGQLAGGVAHDFNNMLMAIMGSAELLQRDLESGHPSGEEVQEIKRAAVRAAELTRQLLAFSRRQVLQPKLLSLNTVVAGTETMLQRLIGEDIEVIIQSDPELDYVKADPAQIEQVIMNLAVNARDAMPNGGVVTVETANVDLDEEYAQRRMAAQPGRYVMMAMSDTGHGMDEEIQAKVFEPFFTTKDPGKGTGLGLATVYGIVKQSGGYIWVYSEPGEGTTFKVYLPVAGDRDESHQVHKLSDEPKQGWETVLVVEDEAAVRTLVCEFLRRYGYAVIEAGEGKEAIRVAARHKAPIHLLVSDVIMPRMKGPELARSIKERHPAIRTLFISGYADQAVMNQGLLDDGSAFLQKPFSPDALARKVREVLDAPAEVPA